MLRSSEDLINHVQKRLITLNSIFTQDKMTQEIYGPFFANQTKLFYELLEKKGDLVSGLAEFEERLYKSLAAKPPPKQNEDSGVNSYQSIYNITNIIKKNITVSYDKQQKETELNKALSGAFSKKPLPNSLPPIHFDLDDYKPSSMEVTLNSCERNLTQLLKETISDEKKIQIHNLSEQIEKANNLLGSLRLSFSSKDQFDELDWERLIFLTKGYQAQMEKKLTESQLENIEELMDHRYKKVGFDRDLLSSESKFYLTETKKNEFPGSSPALKQYNLWYYDLFEDKFKNKKLTLEQSAIIDQIRQENKTEDLAFIIPFLCKIETPATFVYSVIEDAAKELVDQANKTIEQVRENIENQTKQAMQVAQLELARQKEELRQQEKTEKMNLLDSFATDLRELQNFKTTWETYKQENNKVSLPGDYRTFLEKQNSTLVTDMQEIDKTITETEGVINAGVETHPDTISLPDLKQKKEEVTLKLKSLDQQFENVKTNITALEKEFQLEQERRAKELQEIAMQRKKERIENNKADSKEKLKLLSQRIEKLDINKMETNLTLPQTWGVNPNKYQHVQVEESTFNDARQLQAWLTNDIDTTYENLLTSEGLVSNQIESKINLLSNLEEWEQISNSIQFINQSVNDFGSFKDISQNDFESESNEKLSNYFKRELIEYYLDETKSTQQRMDTEQVDKLLNNKFQEMSPQYEHLLEVKNQISKIGSIGTEDNDLMRNLTRLLAEPRDYKSINEQILELEQSVLNTYWALRQVKDSTSRDLANELQKVINTSNGLHLPHKYGKLAYAPKRVKGEAPQLAALKNAQDTNFADEVNNLKFYKKNLFDQLLGKTQPSLNFNKYFHQSYYPLNAIDAIDTNTSENKARIRIMLKDIVDRVENPKKNINKESLRINNLNACHKLLSPAQMESDEIQFPFICMLQKLKNDLSPNRLKTRFRSDIDNMIRNIAGDEPISESNSIKKLVKMKVAIQQARYIIQDKVQDYLRFKFGFKQSNVLNVLDNYIENINIQLDRLTKTPQPFNVELNQIKDKQDQTILDASHKLRK